MAETFSQSLKVIGFDNDTQRVSRLIAKQAGRHKPKAEPNLTFTTDPLKINESDFIMIFDPLLDNIEDEFAIKAVNKVEKSKRFDAVVVTVAHRKFRKIKLSELKEAMNHKPVLVDVRQMFDRGEAEREGFYYETL